LQSAERLRHGVSNPEMRPNGANRFAYQTPPNGSVGQRFSSSHESDEVALNKRALSTSPKLHTAQTGWSAESMAALNDIGYGSRHDKLDAFLQRSENYGPRSSNWCGA
jgi:hypothetical protein